MKPVLAILAAILLPGGLPLLALMMWRRSRPADSGFATPCPSVR